MKLLKSSSSPFLIAIAALLLCSCARQAQLPNVEKYKTKRKLFVAWNEDTLNSYHLIAFADRTFYYGIRKIDSLGNESQRAYVGKIKYEDESIYLKFKGKNPPEDLNPILIKEVSGTYLIQYFNNSKARYFLRLNYAHHRF